MANSIRRVSLLFIARQRILCTCISEIAIHSLRSNWPVRSFGFRTRRRRDRRPEVAPQPAEQVGEVGGLESFRERRHQRCRQTAHAHYIFAQKHLLDAAGLYEIGRASCRERVESSGVAVTVKNKERKWYV